MSEAFTQEEIARNRKEALAITYLEYAVDPVRAANAFAQLNIGKLPPPDVFRVEAHLGSEFSEAWERIRTAVQDYKELIRKI